MNNITFANVTLVNGANPADPGGTTFNGGNVVFPDVADPVSPQDAATKNYVDNNIAGNPILANASPTPVMAQNIDITLDGGSPTVGSFKSLTVNIANGFNANGFNLGLVPDPIVAQDIATKNYVDNSIPGVANAILANSAPTAIEARNIDIVLDGGTLAVGSFKSLTVTFAGAFNANGFSLGEVPDPTSQQDIATKNYVDNNVTPISNPILANSSPSPVLAQNIDITLDGGTTTVGSFKSLTVNGTGNFNANGFSLGFVPNPVNPQDIATKNYVDNNSSGTPTVLNAASSDQNFGALNNYGISTNSNFTARQPLNYGTELSVATPQSYAARDAGNNQILLQTITDGFQNGDMIYIITTGAGETDPNRIIGLNQVVEVRTASPSGLVIDKPLLQTTPIQSGTLIRLNRNTIQPNVVRNCNFNIEFIKATDLGDGYLGTADPAEVLSGNDQGLFITGVGGAPLQQGLSPFIEIVGSFYNVVAPIISVVDPSTIQIGYPFLNTDNVTYQYVIPSLALTFTNSVTFPVNIDFRAILSGDATVSNYYLTIMEQLPTDVYREIDQFTDAENFLANTLPLKLGNMVAIRPSVVGARYIMAARRDFAGVDFAIFSPTFRAFGVV